LTGLKRFITINDEIAGSIPDSFVNLKSLTNFQCLRCAIAGSIPDWIGQWSALQFLFLKDSQLTGSFPTSMASLTNLIELSVEANLMSGDFSAVEGMTKLKYLYAEDNAFTQTIDATFLQNLPELETLDISDNGFIGQVPVHLMGLPTLTTMDIHGNSLTSFPDAIPENGNLDFLAIFGNPITGPFPSNTITNLASNLDHLDATSTQFTGDMPLTLGNMTKLGYLFLADTTFNAGPMPDELQGLTNLVDFSLKDAGRTGMLPAWLGDLDKIVLLDLDSNAFTGAIPTEIANMANLRVLLLNRNDLTGAIPTELGFLTDLSKSERLLAAISFLMILTCVHVLTHSTLFLFLHRNRSL
jgi:Leucine-rich repeat (LRR) protein